MSPDAPRSRTLEGLGIVVTRPAAQAAPLAQLIRARGGRAILFPTLDIVEPRDPARLAALIDRLDQFDLGIFVSPLAVDKALKAIAARRTLPPKLKLAAVGPGSARALKRLGAAEVIVPAERFDSEALLALPELESVAGKRIAIFRGEEGRELLGDTLSARGATVEYAACYRRTQPQADIRPLLDRWASNELHAFVITSGEGLRNLHAMLDDTARRRLGRTPIFVPHPRIAAVARELDLRSVIETGLGDECLVEGLVQHFQSVA